MSTDGGPDPPELQASPEGSVRLDGLQLLVVDDEGHGRAAVAALLTLPGAQVREAASVSEALRALADQRADLLVSDIEIPGEDGFALLRRLREAELEGGHWTSAIAVTARAGTSERLHALSVECQTHVPTPATQQSL